MTRLALLVPGGRGQLGTDLRRAVAGREESLVHAPGSAELDLTDHTEVTDAVDSFAESSRSAELRPVVINAAAHTAVDAAEQNADVAESVNARGAAALGKACQARGIPLVHVSTDYVFNGASETPYEPDDEPDPRTVYGRTKLAGEQAVLEACDRAWVVRTAWVYGSAGGNFVKTMVRLAGERDALTVVDDQIGSPTYSADLAQGLLELALRTADRQGPDRKRLHCTNSGQTSWFEFARAIFTELGADPARVRPCTSAEYPSATPRPAFSVLSGQVWQDSGLAPLRPWREALAAAFAAERDGFAPRG